MAQPTIPGYSLVDVLGSGGFASVYLATDADDQQVAIKVLHDHASKPTDLQRFERERATMRALNGHPNIVAILDSGTTDDDQQYTVLEFVSGGSVRDRLQASGALHWAPVVEIGVQICTALDVAHRSGVLHRDVKPANILLEGNVAKLGDFGIARLIGQSQVTAAQSIIGTLAYTPPELFHNRPFDGRGDIYQLGITLYEMLLGRAPFTSAAADNKATVIRRILDNPAPPLAQFDVPKELSDLLDEVLAKEPADRPQTAKKFAQRLNEVEVALGRTPTRIVDDSEPVPVDTETLGDDEKPKPERTVLDWPHTVDISTAGLAHSVETTDPGVSAEQQLPIESDVAPTPPVISPPDANVTVVEPFPENTGVLASKSNQPMALGTPGAAPAHYDKSAAPSTTTAPEPKSKSRVGWVLLALGLIGAAVAGVLIAQNTAPDAPETVESDVVDGEEDGEVPDEEPPRTPQFNVLDEVAFLEPLGAEHAVIFDAVRNGPGLTIVGGAGDGESVDEQSPMVWTLDADGADLQREFEEPGRLWSIGVIDGEDFLAVGDVNGPGETDGLAFIGSRAGLFSTTTDSTFTGPEVDSLRASAADPDTGSSAFLVGGRQSVDGASTMGLWSVARPSPGADPIWVAEPIGTGAPGVVSDIAVDGSLAVAVGSEVVDGVDNGVVAVRRDQSWSFLIAPLPNTVLHAVAISGDRVIAVGETGDDPTQRTPIAVVASDDGTGWLHRLPTRTPSGVARDIATLDDGRVVAVGDGPADSSRMGAIWELLPAEEFASDQWTTRASADVPTDQFTELRSIAEYEGTVYIFGRTEEDGRRPAGAWTLDLDA